MADKLRTQQQLENLQARYVGTGHSDTTKFEFTSNIKRDSYASFIGHPPMLSYMAIGAGTTRERMRLSMIDAMIRPVGPPPEEADLRRQAVQPQFFGRRADAIMKEHFTALGQDLANEDRKRERKREARAVLVERKKLRELANAAAK